MEQVGIVYSETTAANYWDATAYAQLVMSAQNQAAMAGVRYDVLTESDLTNLAKLATYDALIFPQFQYVKASDVSAIQSTLSTLATEHHVGLIAAGEFMTNSETGALLPGDEYARMKTLFGVDLIDGGFPANYTVLAGDVTHPVMDDYAPNELIHSFSDAGWLAYTPVVPGADVLATETVDGQDFDAVIATQTGGRNVHFATEEVMVNDNLLWQAIDYAVNGEGVTAGIQLSRNAAIVASRTDMDQALDIGAVTPDEGPGIYDTLLPILETWKSQYDFVGSYYVDIGANPPDSQTDWSRSGQYYAQLLAMGNELGSHTITHPDDTNLLTPAEIQHEFEGSKQIIEQQMTQILGHPFTIEGAAVPGNPENVQTALDISQYYDYISGGFTGAGAGYPSAIGYLTPETAAADKVYIAPNIEFDFSLLEFEGLTPAQAAAEWTAEWNDLVSHADVPVVVWPWHDYGATALFPQYTTSMYTDFIARAYAADAEFVTLGDLAERIQDFHRTDVETSVSGSTITATVTSPDAGKLALDLDNLGTQRIASVTNWYAYDDDSVFLPEGGGTFTVNLGSTAAEVTHITRLPMRAELLSLSGDGTNLTFSAIGEGLVTVDLRDPTGQTLSVTGASVASVSGDILTLDLGALARHDVSVTLSGTPVNHAPTITSNGGADTAATSMTENTVAVTAVTASDLDAGQALAFAILGGADAPLFQISPAGLLSFIAAPNFETPADADHNNSYVVQVRVADNGSPVLADTQTITVNVTDTNDTTPVITTAATLSIPENSTIVAPLTSTDVDTVGTHPALFSISGGADAPRFTIVDGNLVFRAAPDYENPADSGANNSYVVQVNASDGVNVGTKVITVNVTDVADGTNHAPTITSNGGGTTAAISLPENSSAVTTVSATDPDAGNTLTYFIGGGADAAHFALNPTSGALSFITEPDFEAPTDQGGNNVYDVIVGVRDQAGALDTQALAVSVTNLDGQTLNGTGAANTLNGTNEDDSINGRGGNDSLFGRAGNDTLNGAAGDDTLNGGAGRDKLIGGAGDDVFIWDPADASIRAGDGFDTLRLLGSGETIDLTAAPNRMIDGVDVFDLTGTGNNTAVLGASDLFAMSWTNVLRIDGDGGDSVHLVDASEWTPSADQTIDGSVYHAYTLADAVLLVEQQVTLI